MPVLVAADLATRAARPRTSPAGTGSGQCSAGSSRYERISSTMTARSPSISRLVEVRPDDQLAEDVHRAGRLAARDADPVDGRLAVGRRVERPADALDRLADRARRREARRALEGDVLHEMGHAGLRGRLEARTRQDVRRDGDRTGAGKPGADHARPAGQRGSFEHRGRWYRKAPVRERHDRDATSRPIRHRNRAERSPTAGRGYPSVLTERSRDPPGRPEHARARHGRAVRSSAIHAVRRRVRWSAHGCGSRACSRRRRSPSARAARRRQLRAAAPPPAAAATTVRRAPGPGRRATSRSPTSWRASSTSRWS